MRQGLKQIGNLNRYFKMETKEAKSKLGDILRLLKELGVDEFLANLIVRLITSKVQNDAGNKAAGTRMRVTIGEMKAHLTELRKESLGK